MLIIKRAKLFVLSTLVAILSVAPSSWSFEEITGISIDGSDTSSIFRIGLSRDAGESFETSINSSDLARIFGSIEPDLEHVNQLADIFTVLVVNGKPLMRDSRGLFVTWDGRLRNLVPLLEDVSLSEYQEVDIYTGGFDELLKGNVRVFLGYLPEDGILRFTPKALKLTISEDNSIPSISAQTSDKDGDGVVDAIDNCPDLSNPDQLGIVGIIQGVACASSSDDEDSPDVPNIPDVDTYYFLQTLTSQQDGKCFDSNNPGSSTTANGYAFMDTCEDVSSKHWKFTDQTASGHSGFYTLQSSLSESDGRCLESGAYDRGLDQGNGAYLLDCSEQLFTGQLWQLIPQGDDSFQLQSYYRAEFNECLDGNAVEDGALLDGASFMTSCSDSASQLWVLTSIDQSDQILEPDDDDEVDGDGETDESPITTTSVEPIVWYTFDGSHKDSSGNNQDLVGHSLLNLGGKVVGSIWLNEDSDYGELPAGVVNGVNDFTISAWVLLDSIDNWSRIFDFGSGMSEYMFLTPQSGGGEVRFVIRANGEAEQIINGDSPLPIKEWVHVAVTLSGTTGRLYVNGAEVGSNVNMTLNPADLGVTSQNWLGRSQFENDPGFLGRIDEFRIYNRPLNLSEIRVLALLEKDSTPEEPADSVNGPTQAPVVWYPFDITLQDVSGNKIRPQAPNGASIVDGLVDGINGLSDGSVDLDGNNQYITLPTGAVNALDDFSIASWVRLDSTGNWARIFDFGDGTSNYMFLTPQNGITGEVRFAIKVGGSAEQQITGQTALPTEAWTHVAVTKSGSTGILYVNGVVVGINRGMTFKPSDLGDTTQNWLGRSQFDSDPHLDGQLDDFRIYNRSLTATEIIDQANLGVSQKPIVQYSFDSSFADLSGNNLHITQNNGVSISTGVVGPKAAHFFGGNTNLKLPTERITDLNDFTIATWVKIDVGNRAPIFSFGDDPSNLMYLSPQSPSSAPNATIEGEIRFGIIAKGSEEQFITGPPVQTGQWTHVMVTRKGNTGRLFVNGVQVGINTQMTLSPLSLDQPSQNWLGRSQVASSPDLRGSLDEFRIYNRALIGEEIKELVGPDPSLITIMGSSVQLTIEELKRELAKDGLVFVNSAEIEEGQCTIIYASADRDDISAEAGLLTCSVKAGDDVRIALTAVYGGCDVSRLDQGVGSRCEVGVYSQEVDITVSDNPEVHAVIEAKGPNAQQCTAISEENVCLGASADLASESFSVKNKNGSGAGAGIAVGVGIGGSGGYSDGVFSASLDLKLGIGVSIDVSIAEEDLEVIAEGASYLSPGAWAYRLSDPAFVKDANDQVIAVGNRTQKAFDSLGNEVIEVGDDLVAEFEVAGKTVFATAEDIGQGVESFYNDAEDEVTQFFESGGEDLEDIGEDIFDFFGF